MRGCEQVDLQHGVGHAGSMAIRMKEWGMLSVPSPSVKIPTQGLMGWGETAADLGKGLGSVLSGAAEFLNERDRVTAGGELAAFSAELRKIGDETAAALADVEVPDWDASWAELSSPRFEEAVAGLSPAGRAAGAELAAAYSMRASVMARRDKELSRIRGARSSWQQRVDAAVSEGDEQRADRWLQSGKNVFVPTARLEQERAAVRSRARVSRWRNSLSQDAVAALSALRSAADDELPQESDDRRALLSAAERAHCGALRDYARGVSAAVMQGELPDARQAAAAHAAGLISTEQWKGLSRSEVELSTAQLSERMRRIDECAANEDARAALALELALAPIPLRQRGELLRRMEQSATVAEPDRRAMSSRLFRLYHRGAFGSPGDATAEAQLCQYQQQGMALLAASGAESSARWLAELEPMAGAWVCFDDLN